MEPTLTSAIAEYIEQRKLSKLEPLIKARDKKLEKSIDAVAIAQAKVNYEESAAPIEETFTPVIWLTNAAKRARQISMATHAPKYTNGDAKGSSVLVVEEESTRYQHLCTATMKGKPIDAVGNAAVLDVATLLKINVNGESLITQLQKGDAKALGGFTEDKQLLKTWVDGFKKALQDDNNSFHTLNKQVYFPVSSIAGGYHLICPLFSSSIAHVLHQKISSTRFGDSKETRDARKAKKYHERTDIIFPSTAVQNFGGSKPQNISQLNSQRYGQSYLVNCAPPTYKQQLNPPINQVSIFNNSFGFKVSSYLREFKAFLSGLPPEKNNFKIRYKRDYTFVIPIVDQLFNYAALVQSLPPGWASEPSCKLKNEHALWLDVNNLDEKFQQRRESSDWENTIANDFSSWLVNQLKNTEVYRLGDIEHAYFSKICLHRLKKYERQTPKPDITRAGED